MVSSLSIAMFENSVLKSSALLMVAPRCCARWCPHQTLSQRAKMASGHVLFNLETILLLVNGGWMTMPSDHQGLWLAIADPIR